LLIQISLAEDGPTAAPHKMEELRRQLAQLEVEISSKFKNPYV
jgi:hypothetical protein